MSFLLESQNQKTSRESWPSSYDLRPSLQRILAAVDDKISTLEAGKSLFVIMGEDHAVSSQIALQQLAISELSKKFRTSVGLEASYRPMGDILAETVGFERLKHDQELGMFPDIIMERSGYRLQSADHDGTKALAVAIAGVKMPHAHLSHKNLCCDLQAKNISTSLIDIYSYRGGTIKHYEAYKIVRKHDIGRTTGYAETYGVSVYEPHGVLIRNHAMSDNAIEKAIETNAQVFVILTGADHFPGLADCFKNKGQDYIGIIAAPVEPEQKRDNLIVLDDQPLEEFVYKRGRNWISQLSRHWMMKAETAHLEALNEASGNIMTIYDIKEEEAKNRALLIENGFEWIAPSPAPEQSIS